jgi:hypothetical protein
MLFYKFPGVFTVMSRSVGVEVVFAFLLVASAATVGIAPAGAAQERPSDIARQLDADDVEFVITVFDNGSARWTFRYKQTLNESEREDFEAYAERFNDEETEAYRDFRNRSHRLTADGENVTGRTMNATGFRKHAEIETVSGVNDRGIVTMSFVWTNFAVEDGEEIRMGDVFQGGLYVAPSHTLVVERPENLAFARVEPSPPDDHSNPDSLVLSDTVTWEGEREFNDERPLVVFAPPQTESPTPSGTEARPGDGTPESPGGDNEGGFGMWPIVALFVVLLVGAVAFAYRSDSFGGDGEAGAAAGGGGDGDSPGAVAHSGPAIPDEELLSDEDRVLQLLEERGGRMKQVNIVEETGWSKSKVSMLLSDMEEEDQISKLRIGRENVISLAGEEPEAAGSPFEDDDE